MSRDQRENRRRVAQLVAELYDERITSTEFFARTSALDHGDDVELRELIELVRREPANTWLFGISGEVERGNARRIRELVKSFVALDEGDGSAPADGTAPDQSLERPL